MAHIFIFQRLNSWLVFSQHHKMSSKLTFFFHCNWAQDSYFLLNGSMLIRVALFLISHRGFPIKTIFTQSGSWRINANFTLIKSLDIFYSKKKEKRKKKGHWVFPPPKKKKKIVIGSIVLPTSIMMPINIS